ncbi:MAG TPA: hypothetical protein DCP91_02335 [Eggerthellaceae bacterium]|nr:hypothetical protein [Eggerthellaceae bacterium]
MGERHRSALTLQAPVARMACTGLRVCTWAFALAIAMCLALSCAPAAHAVSGNVYACDVHPSYQHPVTGQIEDSGGASARATGQAMVDSCVSSAGMMEVADTGECYLTIRMSLVDLTSGHTFLVQDWGGSGWATPAMGVTGTGRDANGTTNDVCVQLPSENGIVRVSMRVESMGRDVVFYVYADNFSKPASSGFAATIVTEQSQAAATEQGATSPAPQAAPVPDQQTAAEQSASEQQAGTGQQPANPAATAGQSATQAGAGSSAAAAGGVADDGANATTGDAASSADSLVQSTGGATAQGLSLSTAPEGAAETGGQDASAPFAGPNSPYLALWLAIVGAGVVLMLVAATIVYVFRRNWNRWGGTDPDDYSKEYSRG